MEQARPMPPWRWIDRAFATRENYWWRRRESNPGPETLKYTVYVRIPLIFTASEAPVGQGTRSGSVELSPSHDRTSRASQPACISITMPGRHGVVTVAVSVFKT